jgi:tRNA threonylcarbamoyl adenosine modification protein (Sua5/YciO/YrdC/YwlC family)
VLLKFFGQSVNQKYISQVVDALKNGGVIILPTDTVYCFAASIYSNKAIENICHIKNVKLEKSNFSFLCHDLSNISHFARPFSNEIFRMMKNSLPGPYTFILNANSNVPAIFKSNKKTIGIRVPDNAIPIAIVEALGNPLMVSSILSVDSDDISLTDPEEIDVRYGNVVDYVIDGGPSKFEHSTIIDCTQNEAVIVREGKGKVES